MKNRHVMVKIVNLLVIIAVVLSSCGNDKKGESKSNTGAPKSIMVYAAASLYDVLTEINQSFEEKRHVKVKTNMASSGTLARQIEQGGEPDIYISASKKWADYVDSLGFIIDGYQTEIAQNGLVLIAPINSSVDIQAIDSTLNFQELLGQERLSMGDPSHVPAGGYAKESLYYFGWYDDLNILPAKDVRSALMVVEMEEAPIGIVYQTVAQKSEKVKILGSFPEESHKPIIFVAGLCKDNQVAKEFYAFLNSDETKAIWIKYGFKK